MARQLFGLFWGGLSHLIPIEEYGWWVLAFSLNCIAWCIETIPDWIESKRKG